MRARFALTGHQLDSSCSSQTASPCAALSAAALLTPAGAPGSTCGVGRRFGGACRRTSCDTGAGAGNNAANGDCGCTSAAITDTVSVGDAAPAVLVASLASLHADLIGLPCPLPAAQEGQQGSGLELPLPPLPLRPDRRAGRAGTLKALASLRSLSLAGTWAWVASPAQSPVPQGMYPRRPPP